MTPPVATRTEGSLSGQVMDTGVTSLNFNLRPGWSGPGWWAWDED